MNDKPTVIVAFRLPKDLIERLDHLAGKAKRTRSNYLRVQVEELVKRGGLATGVKWK